jgi:hypothetical protein
VFRYFFYDIPPADVDPSTGMPYLSWRVYLLPFIEQGTLFAQFHLNEPWNSPDNLPLLADMPEIYRSRGLPANSTLTGFQIFVGNGGVTFRSTSDGVTGINIPSIKDGTSNTIAVIETAPQDAVAWTRPDGDITFKPTVPLSGLTNPGDYLLAVMFDGSSHAFNPYLDPSTFDEFVTPAGGETLTYTPNGVS